LIRNSHLSATYLGINSSILRQTHKYIFRLTHKPVDNGKWPLSAFNFPPTPGHICVYVLPLELGVAVNYAYKLETTVGWDDVNTEMLNNNINENNARTDKAKVGGGLEKDGMEEDKQLQEAKASRKLNRTKQ